MALSKLESALQELLPLYRDGVDDSPETALDSLPRIEKVVLAHRQLIDLLLPGRIFPEESSRSIKERLLERLEAATALLLPELERALPFRTAGAAPLMTKVEVEKNAVLRFRRTSPETAALVIEELLSVLPRMRKAVVDDVASAYRGDPAALTFAEVKLAYPGILAVVSHRIAHELYRRSVPLIPRIMSEWTHTQTGIDIHPGALIGAGFFVDHGTGVVIGETACIGNNVKIYQGAILGAKSFTLDEAGNPVKHIKRHPTVEDNVVIYSNATILGGDTVVGSGSVIGGSVFLTKSVPPNTLVTNQPPELQMRRGDLGQYEI